MRSEQRLLRMRVRSAVPALLARYMLRRSGVMPRGAVRRANVAALRVRESACLNGRHMFVVVGKITPAVEGKEAVQPRPVFEYAYRKMVVAMGRVRAQRLY